jgi:hypothetical protein
MYGFHGHDSTMILIVGASVNLFHRVYYPPMYVFQGFHTFDPLTIEAHDSSNVRLPAEERAKFRYMPNCEPIDKKEMWKRQKAQEEMILKRAILSDNAYHPKYNPNQNAQKANKA